MNFGKTSVGGKHSCQLMMNSKFKRPDRLVTSEDFDHYFIKLGTKPNRVMN